MAASLEAGQKSYCVLVRIVQSTSTKPEWLRRGCPINNLAQEMSPLDEGFRKRLAKLFGDWYDDIAAAFQEGQEGGLVRSDFDPKERAVFLVAVYEGYLSLAKNSQDVRVLRTGKRILILQLESLRPSAAQNRAPNPRFANRTYKLVGIEEQKRVPHPTSKQDPGARNL